MDLESEINDDDDDDDNKCLDFTSMHLLVSMCPTRATRYATNIHCKAKTAAFYFCNNFVNLSISEYLSVYIYPNIFGTKWHQNH